MISWMVQASCWCYMWREMAIFRGLQSVWYIRYTMGPAMEIQQIHPLCNKKWLFPNYNRFQNTFITSRLHHRIYWITCVQCWTTPWSSGKNNNKGVMISNEISLQQNFQNLIWTSTLNSFMKCNNHNVIKRIQYPSYFSDRIYAEFILKLN